MLLRRTRIASLIAAGCMLIALGLAACAPAAAPSPTAASAPKSAASPAASPAGGSVADQLRGVATEIDSALTAAGASDFARARQAYEGFEQGWDKVEDDVKAKSATAYEAIEDAMDEVKAALRTDKPDATKARDALTKLKQTVESNLPVLR